MSGRGSKVASYIFVEYVVIDGEAFELWRLLSGETADDTKNYRFKGHIKLVFMYDRPLELWQRVGRSGISYRRNNALIQTLNT